PTRPTQDFHLRLVLPAVRAAAVDDVQDSRAVHDRRQELALVVKATIVGVLAEKLADDVGTSAGAAIVTLEPFEHLARALKARRVDELVQDLAVETHRIRPSPRRRAGLGRDRDGIVLRERRDDAALALVRVADDREFRVTHADAVST